MRVDASVVIRDGRVFEAGSSTGKEIRVVKQDESANIPNRRASALKRLADIESELGRLTRLVVELRADVLHLTTE